MEQGIFILNGPSLNRLGTRQPELYGTTTLSEIEDMCRQRAAERGLSIEFFGQTNYEGELISWIHDAADARASIIVNPGAWLSTSVAIADALKICAKPIVEVHLTNIHRRASEHLESLVSKQADCVIAGMRYRGYLHAIDEVADLASVAYQR